MYLAHSMWDAHTNWRQKQRPLMETQSKGTNRKYNWKSNTGSDKMWKYVHRTYVQRNAN